jgi:predicted TIM-barrel fold metal-dependent hydrolase
MDKKGIKLIGELVPYIDGWQRNFASEEFSLLLKEAGKRNMIVSFHSMNEDAMDEMVKRHRDVIFVAAHPGEYNEFMRHIERMKYSENYYLDVSGYGIFRYGMLKRAVDTFGADRILFGSDYPTCNPAMYIGGVMNDSLLSDAEKEKIFSLNAKKLLKLR